MTEKNEVSTKTSNLVVPEFMQGVATGTEELAGFIQPPRLKAVQPLSQSPYDQFSPGDIVATPQLLVVAEMPYENNKPTNEGTPFYFVPIFFFAEYCTWNPIALKGKADAIVARSIDSQGEIAAKARDRNLRSQLHPEGLKDEEGKELYITHVEHLNYVSVIVGDHPMAGTPIVQSFSKGEHKAGTNFAMLIKMRKAPLFGCQFEARCHFRVGPKGKWYGWDVTNPSEDSGVAPFVSDKAQFEELKTLHEEMKAAHADDAIRVDLTDVPQADVVSSPSEF